MTIISSYQETPCGREAVDKQQIQQDYNKLYKLHLQAALKDSTWRIFGGVLQVENRYYQVY